MVYVGLFILLLICGVAWQKRKRADKVGAGLQIFNADGKVIFDSTYNTTRMLGRGETNGTNGSLIDDRLIGHSVWVVITSHEIIPSDYLGGVDSPVFTCNGSKLAWEYGSSYNSMKKNNRFIYGVY